MRFVLLDRGRHREGVAVPHLGFGYVAAALGAAGHEVRYRDIGPAGNGPEPLAENTNIPPGLTAVCLSATTFSYLEALETARRVKAEDPQTLVVLGGPHTSLEPERILECPEFDVLVIGEGEETVVDLANAIEAQGGFDPAMAGRVPGVACRSGGEVRRGPARPWIKDLDRLPFPSFHLFPMALYHHYPLITARGCPYNCVFCSSKLIWGRTWRARSPENILQEIEFALVRHHWKGNYFAILDDTFNLDLNRAEAICEGILKAGLEIRWINAGIRADRVTPSLARKMRRAGCEQVGLGIESANKQVLSNIKKGENLEEISSGIRALREAGIRIFGYFMIGNPGDSLQTVRETIRYAREMGITDADFSLAIPYPGTQLWEMIEREGRFVRKDYYRFHNFKKSPLFETPGFSIQERKRAYREASHFTLRLRIKQGLKLGLQAFIQSALRDPLSVPPKTVRALKRLARDLRK